MKFWLDSANHDDVFWGANYSGFVSGVTVNQSLIAKEPKQDLAAMLQKIADSMPGRMALSLPGTKTALKEALVQAVDYHKMHANVYVKIPVSRETLLLIEQLSNAGHFVNATCVFTGLQAALAAEAGAKILSVFVGRINDDTPGFGWKVIEAARTVCGSAQVLAGSIRDKDMVGAACDHGAHIVTTSRKVLEQLGDDPGTARSVAKFNADLEAWMVAE